jgi:hypothetical protein
MELKVKQDQPGTDGLKRRYRCSGRNKASSWLGPSRPSRC